jgi:hypothetical protein
LYADNLFVCNYQNKRRLFILTNFSGSVNATIVGLSKVVTLQKAIYTNYVGQTIVETAFTPASGSGGTSGIQSGTVIESIQSPTSFTMSNAGNENGTSTLQLAYGGIFLAEEYDYGDQFDSMPGTPVLPFILAAEATPPTDPRSVIATSAPRLETIDARIRSRQYTFDNTNTKRFSRGEYQFNNSPGDQIKILARTHDPDATEFVMDYIFTGSATQDSTLRPRIALRGACVDMEVQFKIGRPALKSASIFAVITNRNMVSEE